jgi:hypothetical protein
VIALANRFIPVSPDALYLCVKEDKPFAFQPQTFMFGYFSSINLATWSVEDNSPIVYNKRG